jgi:hypothetical protein
MEMDDDKYLLGLDDILCEFYKATWDCVGLDCMSTRNLFRSNH